MEELKEIIFKATIEGIMKIYGLDENYSKKIVENSGLDRSIRINPEMVSHCSQEQLVDMVMDCSHQNGQNHFKE
ncbi:hypothetical protein [Clostridium akagii]|uniref:hypothetical protein n=1 Tax=Clostridium akagii TaxID=91623 RepID=UPI00047D137F|nr:hypothetical protein [Clostridium akagii]